MVRVIDRPHNSGKWTAARFRGFIISALRSASNRWPPKYEAKKAAKLRYGVYQCAGYKTEPHEARASQVQIDHIIPVVDPVTGFSTWDNFINRLFCEAENFQLLCLDCHKRKSKDEKDIRSGN